MENNTKKDKTTKNHFAKKLGKTIYQVTINFSKTSKEILQDKIDRLIKNDCSDTKS